MDSNAHWQVYCCLVFHLPLFELTEKIAVFTTSTIVTMAVVRKLIEWKSEWLSATELGKSIMKK